MHSTSSRRSRAAALGALSIALLSGCVIIDPTPTPPAGTPPGGPPKDPPAEDACKDLAPIPATAPAELCPRVAPGRGGARSVAVDLSAAHAGLRFFGAVAKYSTVDQALIPVLAAPEALAKPDLAPYAAALPGVACTSPAATAPELPPAKVEVSGNVAIIRPGTGAVSLPANVKAVAVDLRDLPEVPELRAALEAAVSPALAAPVDRPSRKVRHHDGMTDEVMNPDNAYSDRIVEKAQPPILATGGSDLPIALLTGPALAPEAAELAATLRLANRAWIVGTDVPVSIAEMRWQGVGTTGLAYRDEDLVDAVGRLPDVVPADRSMAHPQCIAADLLAMGAPAPIARGPADRQAVEALDPFNDGQPSDSSLGAGRAALVVFHGATRTFYPYFKVVGDTIDERLQETLASLGDAPTRAEVVRALRRFGNALSDGHNFLYDIESQPGGYMPVYIEDIDGEPVVRRTNAVGIDAGDTITSIGGVPAADWYEKELAYVSAATDGYRFDLATRRYTSGLTAPLELGLRAPDGTTRTIQFQPQTAADNKALGNAPTLRPHGPLTDMGAPDLYYINMSSAVLKKLDAFNVALTEAAGAKGLVVDMRGYPGVNHYEVVSRLLQQSFISPVFGVPWAEPDESFIHEEIYPLDPLDNPSYAGPIVLLVGHKSVSAAENFAIMLVSADRVKVMGRRSAGTNGNITGVMLPGGFAMTYTGMEVLFGDKSQFHGIGIAPDTETTLSAQAFKDGIDPELVEAVTFLSQP
ncbi:S41 family peptidase [Polyangium aurulentum]|uniref:S41 family peptidase n=1 Tax=Polyangium aurulentum TaxID=2567896 RepID=UPI0010ADAD6B|nr:S41 family peptidase [Polyangium aurulentum]UQA57315.1 peptidase S41 [Polyangium aurulentum]